MLNEHRKELKFICSELDFANIQNRIKTIMKMDQNSDGEAYNIRSIYFDDRNNSCFRENEAGVDKRQKFRIRIYKKSDALIHAEIKSKYRDTSTKKSVSLSRAQFDQILVAGKVPSELCENEVIKQYRAAIEAEGFRPVSIVEYERTAFVYPIGNVRVTFDRNIGASTQYDRFFMETLHSAPVLPTGKHILEVKYDELLPDYIAQLLEIGTLSRTSYSKYYFSRMITGRYYL